MALEIGLADQPFLIANGTSLSAGVAIGAQVPVGLWMPAAWTAAVVTFQVSPDGGTTWLEFYDSAGNEITATVAAGQLVALTEPMWQAVNNIKIRSGTAAAPVNQGADRTIQMVVRDFVR